MGHFIPFIIILFILAALLRIDFFFTILYLFIGIYLFSRFWTRRTLKKLKISRNFEHRAYLGEQLTVTLTIQNLSRLPVLWLFINESLSIVLASPPFFREVISLGGQAAYTLHYKLAARRRGYYRIGPLSFETGDLLGINRRVTGQFGEDYLVVYPKILPISQLGLPTHSPQVVLPTPVPLFQDSSRLIGARGYIPGDNPRHIHWPATATSGQLLVKQFQTAIARENAIFLNLDRADYGRPGQAAVAIELAIVAAASLAHHISVVETLPVGLLTTGFDPLLERPQTFQIYPNKGQGHLMQILEVLARVESIDDAIFLKSLRQAALHLSWGTTITVITGSQTEAVLDTLLLLKRAGFKVVLVLVQPAAYIYSRTQPVEGLGIPTFLIEREKDIEVWLPAR
jgi:uncharacterized protein (DUF58 family)